MKSLLIFLALSIIPFKIFSQHEFASFEMENHIETISVVPDTSGTICIYSCDKKNHYFKLIDAEGKVIRTRSFNRAFGSETDFAFTGATITENAFLMIFADFNSFKPLYTVYLISKSDSSDSRIENIPYAFSRNEKFVKTYTDHNHLNLITVSKNKKETFIHFTKFLSEKKKVTKSILIKKSLYTTLKKGNFSIIKNTQNYTIPMVNAGEKMYVSDPDKIVFTMDNPMNIYEDACTDTEVYYFNLKNASCKFYSLDSKVECFSSTASNSFYYQGKIFQIILSSQQIGLSIIDIEQGEILKEYLYGKKDEVKLISDLVISKGKKMFITEEDTLTRNNQIFRNLNSGTPSIAVSQYKGDTLLVLMGSMEVYKGGGGMMVPTGGVGPISTPGGMVPGTTPSFMHIGTPGSSGITEVTWFNAFIKDSTFEIVPNLKDDPDFYKIEKLKEDLREQDVKIDLSAVFKYQNKLFFGYLPKRKSIYKIVGID